MNRNVENLYVKYESMTFLKPTIPPVTYTPLCQLSWVSATLGKTISATFTFTGNSTFNFN